MFYFGGVLTPKTPLSYGIPVDDGSLYVVVRREFAMCGDDEGWHS